MGVSPTAKPSRRRSAFQAATIGCCPGFVASAGGFSLTDAGADGP